MDIYLQYSHRNPRYNFITEQKEKIQSIPLHIGLSFSWKKFSFEYHQNNLFYPKGKKCGLHYFTIRITFLYWFLSINFYKKDNK